MPVQWSLTIALFCVALVLISVEFFFASGYSFDAFGLWRPPNSPLLRTSLLFLGVASSVTAMGTGAHVLFRGSGSQRLKLLILGIGIVSLFWFWRIL